MYFLAMLAFHLNILMSRVVPGFVLQDTFLLGVGITIGALITYFSVLKTRPLGRSDEQKGGETAPQEQLYFLQTLLDAIPVPIFYKDNRGIYLGCNKAFESYIAKPKEQLIGKSVYEIAPKYLADSYFEADQALFREGGVQIYENSVIFADGTQHDAIFNKAIFLNNDGSVGGLVGTVLDITELKKTEAALRESEERFRQLSEATYEGIVIHEQGKILDVNPALCEMFACESAELIGTNSLDYFVASDREWVKKNIQLGNENPYEAIAVKKDGSTFPVEIQGKAIPYKGKIIRGVALRDISDRKANEKALHNSIKRFRVIFEGAAIGIFLASLDGRVVESNPALQHMLGYSSEALKNMQLSEFTHPEDVDIDRQFYEETLIGVRDSYQIEKRYIRSDRSIVWVRVSLSLVRDTDGDPEFNIGMVEDISDRKQTESALWQSEKRFQAIVEGIPIPLTIARISDRSILYANQQAASTFGVHRQELVGRHMADFYWDPANQERLDAELFRQGYLNKCELLLKTADGTVFWVVISAVCVEFAGERAILWTFYDITERVRVEAILRERSRLSTLSAEVGVTLSRGGTLSQILERCTAAMLNHLDANFVGIWTLNSKSKRLELKAGAGEQPATQEFGDRIPVGFSLIGAIAQNRQRYISKNSKINTQNSTLTTPTSSPPSSDPASDTLASDREMALAGYPLIVEERLVGVLIVLGPQPVTEDRENFLGWVANSIAVAIEGVKARNALLSRRESLLFRLASQIRNSLELSDILQTAVDEIQSLLQVDRCLFIWCVSDRDRPTISIIHESRSNSLPTLLGEYTDPSLAELTETIQTLQIIKIDGVTASASNRENFLSQLGLRSQLILPLATRAGQYGAIVCSHCSARAWSNSEVELLRAVTEQVAIAMNQADLYASARSSALSAQTQAEQLEDALRNLQRTQEQLMQTEKMSSLGQLVAGIAHEINNPVTFITGNLVHVYDYALDLLELIQLYQKQYPQPSASIEEKLEQIEFNFLNDDLPKLLSSMESGAERIRKIVLSLRNFSRLDEAEMKQVDIHEGLESTLLILQHRLNSSTGEPNIEIVKQYGDLPKVECYPGQLNQVFMNLLANAIDALERNDSSQPLRRITIHTERVSRSQPHASEPQSTSDSVSISIADSGPGMSEEVKSRLLDPFFTTKPVGAGTGLGMSISYQIVVNQHQGSLNIISEVGKGTQISIEIPVRQSSTQTTETMMVEG